MIDDRLREELNALVDGELEEARADELRARIETDDELRAEFDRLRRVADLVRGLPSARANLAGDVMARLPSRGRLLRPWPWIGGLAAAAAAVLVGVVMLREDEPRPEQWTEAKELVPEPKRSIPDQPDDKRTGRGALREDEVAHAAEEAAPAGAKEEAPGGAKVLRLDSQKPAKGAREPRDEAVSEAEADDEGVKSPAPARREEMEKADAPRAPMEEARRGAARPPTLLERVEKKGTPLTAAERDAYLRLVRGLDAKALQAHFARVGDGRVLPASRTKAKARAAEPAYTFELTAASAEQALALRRTLARAYRSEGTAVKKVAPTAVQAETRDPKGGVLQYSWDATPAQLGTLVVWLERLGLAGDAAAGGVRPARLRITGDYEEKAKDAPPIPVRVRIRYGSAPAGPSRSDDD